MQRRKRHLHSIISSAEQRLRDFEAERLRGLEIDHELEFGRLAQITVATGLVGCFARLSKHPTILRELPPPLQAPPGAGLSRWAGVSEREIDHFVMAITSAEATVR
jgi:hypothetical protein